MSVRVARARIVSTPSSPGLPGSLAVTGTTTTVSSLTINSSGTYQNYEVTGGVTINANNVTLRNCRVRCVGGTSWGVQIGPGVTGTLLDKVEIGGGSNDVTYTGVSSGLLFGDTSTSGYSNVANNVWIHHCIDGIRADGTCSFEWGRVSNMDTSGYPGTHGDGSQSTGWGDIRFLHSEIDGGNNTALFFNQESGNPAIGAVVVDSCRLVGKSGSTGGAWTTSFGLSVGTSGGPVSVTGTAFDGVFNNGPAETFPWATWSSNTYNGAPLAAP